ncbi:dihydrodipicolinate synthase family protein [Pusillimonas sp.]|uniref:dihydrodipicolinate synthase family protein n=1 Tax=Pusillimonas sp. TaxID=3040095 RepID=UPI0029C01350|nr:dihydrodipicolinate synthase family protein [Pusillimonas sp.]
MKIGVNDITGVVGIVPTPATPDASNWDAVNTVNLPETEKMIRLVVEAGVDIVMTTGTFGECATLTGNELVSFVETVTQTVGGKVPVFAGVTTLNTRDTIQRGRELVEVGADGLFVGRPMWLAMDDEAIVRFYRDIATAMPGVPLVVYDNPSAFKGKISTDVYLALAEIPEIVAAKHVGGPELLSDMRAVGKRMRVLPLEMDWYSVAKSLPESARACWSGSVACAPAPLVALAKAIHEEDWTQAERLTEKIQWAMSPMFPGGDLSKFMDYSIPLGHQRFEAAGLIKPGPCRPPYLKAPESYLEGSREAGKRWAVLQKEFDTSITV